AAAQRSAPRRHHRGVMGRDLSFFAAPPKLKTRFVNVAQTVRTATGELPAARVEGQLAIARDAFSTFDKRTAFAARAQSQCLEPDHGQDGEAVVELRGADVRRLEIGA